jgi:hypothetical protein
MTNISSTQHGQNVLNNTLGKIGAEGGGSIEAQIQAVFAMAYDTNVQVMKSKVQEYRAKLGEQQKINQTLADLERFKASGFDNADPGTKRRTDLPEHDKACECAMDVAKKRREGKDVSYEKGMQEWLTTGGGKDLKPAEKEAYLARARMVDTAARSGLDVDTLSHHNDGPSLIKGDSKNAFVDSLKAKLKANMDALGADSQLQMIDIQTIKGRMDAAMNALTTVIKGDADTKQKLSNNL